MSKQRYKFYIFTKTIDNTIFNKGIRLLYELFYTGGFAPSLGALKLDRPIF